METVGNVNTWNCWIAETCKGGAIFDYSSYDGAGWGSVL